ncbi:MAG: 6,7-dimethyl-8-ribityllumazine synthase, partial [Bacteroidota bacterium]
MTQPGHDLSHIHYTGTENHRDTTVAIVASKWNPEVLEALLEGAWRTLVAAGIPEKQVLVY